jgi:hypothetical protein
MMLARITESSIAVWPPSSNASSPQLALLRPKEPIGKGRLAEEVQPGDAFPIAKTEKLFADHPAN